MLIQYTGVQIASRSTNIWPSIYAQQISDAGITGRVDSARPKDTFLGAAWASGPPILRDTRTAAPRYCHTRAAPRCRRGRAAAWCRRSSITCIIFARASLCSRLSCDPTVSSVVFIDVLPVTIFGPPASSCSYLINMSLFMDLFIHLFLNISVRSFSFPLVRQSH